MVGQRCGWLSEIDEAVLAREVAELALLRFRLVADEVIADAVLVEVLAGAIAISVFGDWVFVDMIC